MTKEEEHELAILVQMENLAFAAMESPKEEFHSLATVILVALKVFRDGGVFGLSTTVIDFSEQLEQSLEALLVDKVFGDKECGAIYCDIEARLREFHQALLERKQRIQYEQ
jgi:hypothetical protein